MLSDAIGFIWGVIIVYAVIMSNKGKSADETDAIKSRHMDDLLSHSDDYFTDPVYSYLEMNIYHTDDTHIDTCNDDWKY